METRQQGDTPTTVLLADDHAIVRMGFRLLLETAGKCRVVGEAASGEEACSLYFKLNPDVLVIDIAMPGMGGLEAMNSLAIALTQRGGHERARRLLSDVLERSPRSATTWSNLGLLELSAHRSVEAGRAFEQAVAADPRLGQAWEGLGAARARSDPSGAIDAWKHAVDVEPRNYDVLFNLAVMLRDNGRAAEARPYVERFVREAPADRYARDIAMMRSWIGQDGQERQERRDGRQDG